MARKMEQSKINDEGQINPHGYIIFYVDQLEWAQIINAAPADMQLKHNSQHETALIAHGTIEWASLFHVMCLCSTTTRSSSTTTSSSPHSTGCLAFTLLSVPSQYTGSQHPVTHTKHPARKWGPGKQILRGEERRRTEREALSWWVWCRAEVLEPWPCALPL